MKIRVELFVKKRIIPQQCTCFSTLFVIDTIIFDCPVVVIRGQNLVVGNQRLIDKNNDRDQTTLVQKFSSRLMFSGIPRVVYRNLFGA